jgi:DNA-binding transcriptional MerR regulator
MEEPPPNLEPLLSIGKVAKQYQVTLRTLRFYESADLLHPMHRGTTRLYRAGDCLRLEMILSGRQLGFSIAEIQNLLKPRKDKVTATDFASHLSSAEVLAKIESLKQRRDKLDQAIHELRERQKAIDHQQTVQDNS